MEWFLLNGSRLKHSIDMPKRNTFKYIEIWIKQPLLYWIEHIFPCLLGTTNNKNEFHFFVNKNCVRNGTQWFSTVWVPDVAAFQSHLSCCFSRHVHSNKVRFEHTAAIKQRRKIEKRLNIFVIRSSCSPFLWDLLSFETDDSGSWLPNSFVLLSQHTLRAEQMMRNKHFQ